ncbi:unnamed protein product [Paramecium sonneborni]|uniref:Homospermidine synthase n=1 Tax=Paramecium sonneborni TaxID=65129 RepID=A0A8S1PHY5_9CILI|nr:unnamed protein product [Paramecium sonneborni]
MSLSLKCIQRFSSYPLPRKIGVLGYGAIGSAFVEVLLKNHPNAQIVALDKYDAFKRNEKRFECIIEERTKENIDDTLSRMGLESGDILVDLSTNIEFLSIWPLCVEKKIRYMNTALEQWEDSEDANSCPKDKDEAYKLTLGYIRDKAKSSKYWNPRYGATSILEMGFNPGVISHCVKRGLEDCAKYYLKHKEKVKDVNKQLLKKYLEARNHSKLAQVLGVHTIHCSEYDNQMMKDIPKDSNTKFYNTWSCRGFLTEGLVPIQVARGSHEDPEIQSMFTIRNGKTIVSTKPSVQTFAKSWLPNQDITGVLIPHGEAYSIQDYLADRETGYAPSQYYVYDYNPLAKKFIAGLPKNADINNTHPEMEVIHPINHPSLRGVDKVGAMIIMNNNRGWWTGSIMDEVDSSMLFNGRFGPTVLQVVGGVYAGFLWSCINPNIGSHFPESIDTDFLLNIGQPMMGRFLSVNVDLTKTSIKDCYKLQNFICDKQ